MIPRIRTLLPGCLLGLSASHAQAESWFEMLVEISERRDAGNLTAAAELGSELVALATRDFGEISDRVAESHLVAAETQLAAADVRGAETSLLQAIDVYDRLDGPISTKLIEPYTILGDAYRSNGEHELAFGAYFEARNISRRAYGLYNPDQVDVVHKMADAAAASGDIANAIELQQESVYIVRREYGESSRELFDEIYRVSDWLSERGYHAEAAVNYQAASSLLRFGLDSDPLEVVHTLRMAATSFRRANLKILRPPSELGSALEIVRRMGNEPLLEAEILRDIGDWHVGSGRDHELEQAYLDAWRTLARLENGDEIRRAWFSATTPVYLAPFRSRELSTSDDAPRGYVDVEFTVNTNGTADRIEVIAAEPEGLIDKDAKQRVNNSRFRPAIEDGRVVAAKRVLRLHFAYDSRYVRD